MIVRYSATLSLLTPSYLQFGNHYPAHLSKDLKKLNQKASSHELQHNLISTSLHSLHTYIHPYVQTKHKNEYRKGQKSCCSNLSFHTLRKCNSFLTHRKEKKARICSALFSRTRLMPTFFETETNLFLRQMEKPEE